MLSETSPGYRLAEAALELGAIKVDAQHPFTWASGHRMPVYNDNRLLLGQHRYRQLVSEGFQSIMQAAGIEADVVAGTATAGIPHATTLANDLRCPLIYVRPAAKEHGLQNQIEGPLSSGQKVVVVEDLVSTGGSVLKVVQALRDKGAKVEHCLGIFSYGFPDTLEKFREQNCELHTLLTFDQLLEFMSGQGRLEHSQLEQLKTWRTDPYGWATE